MKRMVCIESKSRPFLMRRGQHYLVEEQEWRSGMFYAIYELDGSVLFYLNEYDIKSMFATIDEYRELKINDIVE